MRFRRFLFVLVFFLILVSIIAVVKSKNNSASKSIKNESGDYAVTLVHQGINRSYLVHVPVTYSKDKPTPVVLSFHGGGANAEQQMNQSLMNTTSDKEGFIVVYPEGTGKKALGKIFGTWNAGKCCGYAEENKIDDVDFVRQLITDLEKKFNIDSKRIYATGHSNGALMSYRLACDLADKIAAVAPNSGQDPLDICKPVRPISVLAFHGTADPAATYTGGHCGGKTAGDPGWECDSVENYNKEWAAIDKCDSSKNEVIYQKGDATCTVYTSCAKNAEVGLCKIVGAGHTWPGGVYVGLGERAIGKISQDISANEVMWDFFQKHPLP